jgi:metal-responsive CopG/Arc/MetJ family transcriptional regulator
MYHKEVKKVSYTNVSIPNELLRKVESVISSSEMGYRNRSEFIIEAVREKIMKETKKEVKA